MRLGGLSALSRPLVLRLNLLVLVAVLAGAGTVSGWQPLGPGGGGSLGALTAGLTAVFSLDAARRNQGRMRAAWTLIAVYLMMYGVADGLTSAPGAAEGSTALQVANTISLLAFVPGTIGLLVYPVLHTERGMWRSMVLDAMVLGLAVVYVTHALVLRPVFASAISLNEAIMLAAYPLGSGLASSIALLLLLRSAGPSRPDIVLIGLAFAVFAAADNGYALMTVSGGAKDWTLVDLAYTLAPLAIAVAAAFAATSPTPRRQLRRHLSGVVSPLLPDLAALGALVAGTVLAPRDTASTIFGVITIVAIGIRQVAQTRDGWRLRGQLEDRVAERTWELEELTLAYRRLDAMKHEFVTAVSHELRTPLAAIRGSLEMLHDGDAGELPPSARPMLAVASRGSERLSRLVDDIIDLERLESGTFSFAPASHRLADLVADAADSLASLAVRQQVELRCRATQERAWCDADRVVQVLVNLLSNALKFSPPGTAVEVTVAREDDTVLVEVRDRGRGIPATELEAIFDRFHQVDMDDSRQLGGTGLGLPISRRIVERHGGRIWAESDGSGATFRFSLPASTEPSPGESDHPTGRSVSLSSTAG